MPSVIEESSTVGSQGAEILVQVSGLKIQFPLGTGKRKRVVHAVDGVDLQIRRGETLGLIGESGSGKSTLGRAVLGLHAAAAGNVIFDGRDLSDLDRQELRRLRARMSMIFQNPVSSVNRRMVVSEIVSEPLRIHKMGDRRAHERRVAELLEMVGLPRRFSGRYPHELSGGQLQRVGIARALSTGPEFVVADEPTASLDVSVRAQVMNLLADLKKELDLTMLFVSHDLSIVSYLADRLSVMYLGRIVEYGKAGLMSAEPLHPYTRALTSAVPRPNPRLRNDFSAAPGEIPNSVNPPVGCHYYGRCRLAVEICATKYPELTKGDLSHPVACHVVHSENVSTRSTTTPSASPRAGGVSRTSDTR